MFPGLELDELPAVDDEPQAIPLHVDDEPQAIPLGVDDEPQAIPLGVDDEPPLDMDDEPQAIPLDNASSWQEQSGHAKTVEQPRKERKGRMRSKLTSICHAQLPLIIPN